MRLKVVYAPPAASRRRLLVPLPQDLELVADLARHLHSRLESQDLESGVILTVDGFTLIPAQRIGDVVRDGDEVTVGKAAAAASVSGVLSTALEKPKADAASLCSPPAKKRPRRSVASAGKDSGLSPASQEWVEALADKIGSGTPSPSPSAAEALRAAKALATARAQELAAAAGDKAVTSAEAASHARQALKAAKGSGAFKREEAPAAAAATTASPPPRSVARNVEASAPAAAKPVWPPSRSAASSAKSGKSGSVTDCDKDITHPVLGELTIPAGEDVDEFVGRKLKTLRKAVRRQVEHYFSEANWAKDNYLQSLADTDGFVEIAAVTEFERLKKICTDIATIKESMESSQVVELSACGSRLRTRRSS